MDMIRKKFPNHTELAYREAVSKLKYFLAESYAPSRFIISKPLYYKRPYLRENININNVNPIDADYVDDAAVDAQSAISETSKRDPPQHQGRKYYPRLSGLPATTNAAVAGAGIAPSNEKSVVQSSSAAAAAPPPPPTELLSFIERQEEYIEQLERESQYCKDELKGLLEKVKEVVAENEALQDKYKSGLMKTVLDNWQNDQQQQQQPIVIGNGDNTNTSDHLLQLSTRKPTGSKPLEGPSIVFESRIAELEAQLTQSRLELKKARDDNQANIERLTELRNQECQKQPQQLIELERASRERRELETKCDELQRELVKSRSRDAEIEARNKRAAEQAQQAEYEKVQAEAEVRRLRDELERRQDKLRETLQETNRRIADEKLQVERRFSQQMEQLSADAANNWEAASKSNLEAEKQRREIADLKRELGQKRAYIEDVKKEMQAKCSKMQDELNEAIAQKDASQEEVAAVKLTSERTERQARQEQTRLQAEVNSYRMRLERADADLVHARRENLRLAEEIAALEKEINMNKLIGETRVGAGQPMALKSSDKLMSKDDKDMQDKDFASLILDLESKQAKTIASLEDSLNKQASLVSRLTTECQSLTRRLEANDQKHKKEMASLQDSLKLLSSRINGSIDLGAPNDASDEGLDDTPIPSAATTTLLESPATSSKFTKDNEKLSTKFEELTASLQSNNTETIINDDKNEIATSLKYAIQQQANDEQKFTDYDDRYDQYPEYFNEQQYDVASQERSDDRQKQRAATDDT